MCCDLLACHAISLIAEIAIVNDLTLDEQWYVYHKTRLLTAIVGHRLVEGYEGTCHTEGSSKKPSRMARTLIVSGYRTVRHQRHGGTNIAQAWLQSP